MESKLIYHYPQKADRITERNNKLRFLDESKKAKKKMIFSSLAGLIIIIMAIIAPLSWFRIPVAIIGLYSLFVSYIGYKFQIMSLDTECYTRIYSDRIEHLQYDLFRKNKVLYTIVYDNIKSSRETYLGYIEIELSSDADCRFLVCNESRKPLAAKNNKVTLNFQDYNTKQFIKVNMKKEFKIADRV